LRDLELLVGQPRAEVGISFAILCHLGHCRLPTWLREYL
jgi:hypothetical protein